MSERSITVSHCNSSDGVSRSISCTDFPEFALWCGADGCWGTRSDDNPECTVGFTTDRRHPNVFRHVSVWIVFISTFAFLWDSAFVEGFASLVYTPMRSSYDFSRRSTELDCALRNSLVAKFNSLLTDSMGKASVKRGSVNCGSYLWMSLCHRWKQLW